MKVGDLVKDINYHPIRNPDGNRLGIIKAPLSGGVYKTSRYEVAWVDGGDDRFVSKRDLELISEGR
jgi:hypothetical protein